MSQEVAGIPLSRFEDPIQTAVRRYQEIADGLIFDPDLACKLMRTPDKPNSARGMTQVRLGEEKIGDLYVIAFKPGDGTGDESARSLKDLIIPPPYPRLPRVVPRDKIGIHSEGHFTILRHKTHDSHAEPWLYAGTLHLLGLGADGKTIEKIGELGHSLVVEDTDPLVTLTTGYWNNSRFGDPHAVYCAIENEIQVCGFLAIRNEVHTKYPKIWGNLNPQPPRTRQRMFLTHF